MLMLFSLYISSFWGERIFIVHRYILSFSSMQNLGSKPLISSHFFPCEQYIHESKQSLNDFWTDVGILNASFLLHKKVFSGYKIRNRIIGTRSSSFSQSKGQVTPNSMNFLNIWGNYKKEHLPLTQTIKVLLGSG